ncbi:MAG: PAS domain S-box protein [Candidatus Aminicenantes bacterium]|nr:PAS domain S-box protein [Candidatus Aminicenantes bacterium]NIM84550.1 PAS domain S-box protein [Candidatus Aminicenantes bacterium]NIN22608.1 PAS domain S-box protein [Candidatus Aminicenantes bacterium]NIN46370.1 PAS domain S-box protein [Candidatus Aminicenantes bacterium]NIN89218.1 PAS domain S-box protein [Candidatus Aminicenantes bacterium]
MINQTLKPVIPRLVILFLLLVPTVVYSQSYLTKTYSISDGLASPVINGITQDKKGIMWFATLKGVTSYDGMTWKNYSKADGLEDTEYYYIHADTNGNTWVFTRNFNDGIFCFNGSQWIHIKSPRNDNQTPIDITAVAMMDGEVDEDVQFGIGTAEKGFYIYKHKQSNWIHTMGSADSRLRLGSPAIFSAACYDRLFYLGTDHGLFMVDPAQPQDWIRKYINVPSLPIYSLTIERDHYLYIQNESLATFDSISSSAPSPTAEPLIWLTGEKWVGYCSQSKNKFYLVYKGQLPGFRKDYHYKQLVTLPDRFGGLWLGNRVVFLNIDKNGRLENIGKQNNLKGNGGYAIFYDREANLWVGTFRGLAKIISFRFENYSKLNGLYDDEVTAISELGQGDMVFGHNGGFTFLIDNKITTHEIPGKDEDVLVDSRVLDMCRDQRGNVWAAVSRMGIVRITLSRQMKWFKDLNPDPKKSYNYYSSIMVDSTGNIWASVDNRVFKWNTRENRFILIKAKINIQDNIRRLFRGSGIIYIATNKSGIFRLKGNHIEPIFVPNKREVESVFAVYPDKEGNLFLGTNSGLFVLEDGKLIKYQRQWFQVDNPVYFITRDHNGYLWFGLNNGVIKWSGGQQVRHYSMQDGLAGNETNRAAGVVDSKGRVWIGTDQGVSCYNRERDKIKRAPPVLELLHVEAAGIRYSLNRDNVLEYNHDDLTFHFRGISFVDEKSLKYNLKLEGFDDHWTNEFQSPNNQIRYTNIPPGNYRFHIQAVNSLGIRSDILVSGIITIKKPAFQAGWFYFMLIVVLVFLIILITNFVSKKRYAFQLEEQVRQRTQQLEVSEKELRDIFNTAHDAIIVFDPNHEIVYNVNKRACDMYGFTRPEFIGMSMETISKDVRTGKSKIKEVMQRGSFLNFETIQYRKDGTEMILEVNASVINYRGKPAILSISRDITERKHAEQQIKRSLKEKEILLKEIHHRVKNNMQIISSLLDLQSDALGNPTVLQAFQDSKNRIRSMALVHENLYQSGDLARISTEEYILSVVDYFLSTYGNFEDRIVPNIQVENISLDMDTAVPIGLILTELLSNALKHAFLPRRKGKLTIRFRSQGKKALTLIVQDNGVGLPEDIDINGPGSLGLQLVSLLTRQLQGTIEVERRSGTSFKVTFPYPVGGKTSEIQNTTAADTMSTSTPIYTNTQSPSSKTIRGVNQ